MTNTPPPAETKQKRQRLVAVGVAAAVGGMLGMSYAAVPLYRMFCAATGFGGTTQVAEHAPSIHGTRHLTVSFDANVAPGLDWSFEPETPRISVLTGETQTVFFKVTNRTDQEVTARAGYNVSPGISGAYFDKINCFCFSNQTLAPHETAEMPVVFFLDAALEKDKDMAVVAEITLSYTFFPVKAEAPAVAAKTDSAKDKSRL
ncbi:cytochrome c oxidase assembly protein [Methyloferula stellata]|uniref:cytochrome c oxidase assembly protein n=1 Tax=Methyloferula stellata TaxID=876270 RepID=UPI00037830CD|nr:cytochrome c oxidase assembly protein [Methyloferula stellata]